MTAKRIEFVHFVEKTGTTTRRALFRVFEDDDLLCSVKSGVSYSLLATLGIGEEEGERLARQYAPRRIEELHGTGELLSLERHDGDVLLDLNTYTGDVDELLRLLAGG